MKMAHWLVGCLASAASLASVATVTNAQTRDKVGILVSSFGDVDSKEEIEAFVKKTLSDPDVAPLPNLGRNIIVWLGWELEKKSIYSEYEAIGWSSHFRANSQRQVSGVARELAAEGYDAVGYTGFTMTQPWVEDTLGVMRRDGVNRVVIFYQGAQYSRPTAYIVQRNAARQLEKMPEWKVRVTQVKSFSDDPRFRKLLVDGIEQRLEASFANYRRNEVCLVLPMHGNPMSLVRAGDPAYGQMMRVVDHVRESFPDMPVYYGFQNHDELSKDWTLPKMDDVTRAVAQDACRAVLINGRISFTVDSLETLYDHAIAERDEILALAPAKPVFVEKMFNYDPEFVSFLKELTVEALEGRGDIVELR